MAVREEKRDKVVQHSVYITTDGREFDSEWQANQYETSCQFSDVLQNLNEEEEAHLIDVFHLFQKAEDSIYWEILEDATTDGKLSCLLSMANNYSRGRYVVSYGMNAEKYVNKYQSFVDMDSLVVFLKDLWNNLLSTDVVVYDLEGEDPIVPMFIEVLSLRVHPGMKDGTPTWLAIKH